MAVLLRTLRTMVHSAVTTARQVVVLLTVGAGLSFAVLTYAARVSSSQADELACIDFGRVFAEIRDHTKSAERLAAARNILRTHQADLARIENAHWKGQIEWMLGDRSAAKASFGAHGRAFSQEDLGRASLIYEAVFVHEETGDNEALLRTLDGIPTPNGFANHIRELRARADGKRIANSLIGRRFPEVPGRILNPADPGMPRAKGVSASLVVYLTANGTASIDHGRAVRDLVGRYENDGLVVRGLTEFTGYVHADLIDSVRTESGRETGLEAVDNIDDEERAIKRLLSICNLKFPLVVARHIDLLEKLGLGDVSSPVLWVLDRNGLVAARFDGIDQGVYDVLRELVK